MSVPKPRALLGALAAAGALLPLLAHRPAAVRPAGARQSWPHRARGVVHVHTGASDDARGSLQDVTRAARAEGLDFVVVTDHNTQAGDALRQDSVLVIVGMEKSTTAGHASVLGTGPLPFRLDGDPDAVTRDAHDLGGFVVVSHPSSTRAEGRWTGRFEGVAGIEVLNLAEPQGWPSGAALLLPLARATFDRPGALLSALRFGGEDLALWERVAANRPVAALLGSDAHGGLPVGRHFLPFPSYRDVFRLASQHLLLPHPLSGDATPDARLVLECLRDGRGYLAVDGLAPATGFLIEARSHGRRASMGESLALEGEAEIAAFADAPDGATLVLLRNGVEVARGASIAHRTVEPGVYRVEARLPGWRVPWILANPVYLFPAAALAARHSHAARVPPLDPPVAGPVAPAESPHWQTDVASGASVRHSLESGVLRFDFALGPGPVSHASICDWGPRDLSGFGSIVFRVRADRLLRFDVQVRVADPQAPAGVAIFRHSVRGEPEWRQVAVRFDALTSYDKAASRPDLGRVTGVYLQVDEAMLPPRSRATLWLDGYGFGR